MLSSSASGKVNICVFYVNLLKMCRKSTHLLSQANLTKIKQIIKVPSRLPTGTAHPVES